MALLAPVHMPKKGFMEEKKETFRNVDDFRHCIPDRDSVQRQLWPIPLPGILKALAGEYFPVSLCVCAAVILGFFLWMILDIRKLTNDLCRMLCLGVLGGFLVQTLYSLACLAGLGPYEMCFFLCCQYGTAPVLYTGIIIGFWGFS